MTHAPAYDVLKTKWRKRQDTETVVFANTRADVIIKLRNLVQYKIAALNGGIFTDEERNISKFPMVGLYKNNVSPTLEPREPYRFTAVNRLSTNAPQSKFYVDGTTPGDVRQGGVGARWFLAILAATADVPGLVDSVVEIHESVKIYGFTFFKGSGWIGTIVDDYMFYNGTNLAFSMCKDLNETWVPLLEKAFAKINGDYESIDGSYGQRGIHNIFL